MKLNPKKCSFVKQRIEYLGHVVTPEGIFPDPGKVEVVKNFPKPASLKELKSFLGLANYYRRFIKGFIKGCDLDSLLCEINNHLPAVYDWLCSNKLTLNLTKTKYIIFMPRQKESYNLYPPLTVDNVYLDKSSCVKCLGVYIDCHLTWHDHIDYICGKISKNI